MADIKRIVRVVDTDVDGSLSTIRALRKVRGINWMTGRSVCAVSQVDPRQQIGALGEEQMKKLQEAIKSQSSSPTLPRWMLNRRKDRDTGNDMHIVGPTLQFRAREDINFQRRIRSRHGIRHELGLPVRGQHTKSTGRKQKTVGVSRKRAAPAPKAAPAAAAKPAAGKPAAAPAKAPAPAKK